MKNETTYRLLSLTSKGEMYSCGDEAATPELARLGLGSLAMRLDEPIVIEQCRWTISADGHRSLVSRVLFERVDLAADADASRAAAKAKRVAIGGLTGDVLDSLMFGRAFTAGLTGDVLDGGAA